MKYDLLRKIRLHGDECAVVRVKTQPGDWHFIVWNQNADIKLLPTEFGRHMTGSALATSLQAYTSDNYKEACEAWVFSKADYDAVWMEAVQALQDSPRRRRAADKIPWWNRWFRLA